MMSGYKAIEIISKNKHWRIQGGCHGARPPPTGSISFVFTYIFTEKCTRWRLAPPPNGSAPPQWEILDPPLNKCIKKLANEQLQPLISVEAKCTMTTGVIGLQLPGRTVDFDRHLKPSTEGCKFMYFRTCHLPPPGGHMWQGVV